MRTRPSIAFTPRLKWIRYDGYNVQSGEPDKTPTISCTRCDQRWELDYELDELGVGNRALERFALDHRRHTGHFPDDVTPWVVDCRHCPDEDAFLSERPARRWAQTHARHARHGVDLHAPEDRTETITAPDE